MDENITIEKAIQSKIIFDKADQNIAKIEKNHQEIEDLMDKTLTNHMKFYEFSEKFYSLEIYPLDLILKGMGSMAMVFLTGIITVISLGEGKIGHFWGTLFSLIGAIIVFIISMGIILLYLRPKKTKLLKGTLDIVLNHLNDTEEHRNILIKKMIDIYSIALEQDELIQKT